MIIRYCIHQNAADNNTIGYPANRGGCFRITNTKADSHRKSGQVVDMIHLLCHFLNVNPGSTGDTLE